MSGVVASVAGMSSTGSIVGHPVVTGIRGAAEDLDPGLAGVVWQLCDDEVEAGLAGLFDVASRVAALQGALLREAEVRDLRSRTRALTVVRWLGDRFQLSRAEGAARVRAAEGIGRHPVVQCALATGTVSPEQAEVLARVLDTIGAMPGVEEAERAAAGRFLVAQCDTLTPGDLSRAGRALVEALTVTPSVDDPADAAALEREAARAEAAAQEQERNVLTVTHRRGRLLAVLEPGTLGEAVLQGWLRAKADPTRAGCDGFEDTRPLSERRGDALVDLLAAAAGTPTPRAPADHAPHEPEHEHEHDEHDEDHQNHEDHEHDERDEHGEHDEHGERDERDELLELLDDALEDPPPGPLPKPGPVQAVLTVTTTVEGLRSGLARAGRLDTGLALSAAALRMLACDALVVPAVLGTASEVLDLGRAQRDFNRAQRRAAALRDRGCVAPGCDQPPSACHAHHMWWWIDGGPTDLDNAALLCGFHHRMVHRQGWAMTLAANGYPQLIPPTTIDPQQRPRQHHRFLIPAQTDRTLLTGRHRT